uniref:Uncharacterized protein n=1 Tax=Caulerpa manorensis TaxID=717648 RepID=A0A2P0QIF3_9CHLO|nr:hypothetical protein [Caulerpa manorensis]ARO74513.1 hypothetical protein [Caulerpa manorensis]
MWPKASRPAGASTDYPWRSALLFRCIAPGTEFQVRSSTWNSVPGRKASLPQLSRKVKVGSALHLHLSPPEGERQRRPSSPSPYHYEVPSDPARRPEGKKEASLTDLLYHLV